MKSVVITGGAGFLGSHLCDLYLNKGCRVTCVDNLLTGSRENIRHLSRNRRFSFLKKDVSRPFAFKGRVDLVLHFASPASPVDYLKHPVETMRAGSLGTEQALELTRSKKAVFLLASTSEIYGDPLVHPQPEKYWGNVNPIGLRSVYDEAKRFAEALTMAYRRTFGVDTRIARIFNTYGPRMKVDDGRAVPNFIDQALRGDAISIYGDGRQTRSFCYVSDLIDGIYRLGRSRCHETVNIGNPREMTLIRMAEMIKSLTRSASPIVFKPLPKDDPRQRKPDISRARAVLKWQPKVGLEEGLSATIAWFKQQT